MLTWTYEIDARGRWRRRLEDLVEDVVAVCRDCGHEAAGRFEVAGEVFTLLPPRGEGDERIESS